MGEKAIRQELMTLGVELAQHVHNNNLAAYSHRVVRKLSDDSLRYAARMWLEIIAKDEYRARMKSVERNAEQTHSQRESTINTTHMEWTPSQEYLELCRRQDEESATRRATLHQKMQDAIQGFKDCIQLELTEELLDAGFALPDGFMVTWRDATVDQHTLRVKMLETNVMANAEAAGRHRHAIDVITSHGVQCLGEVITVDQ